MALFKTPEEKELQLLQKYGLENLNDPQTISALKNLENSLKGSKALTTGYRLGLQGDKALMLDMMKAQIDQNFIIIRQLDKLNQLLDK